MFTSTISNFESKETLDHILSGLSNFCLSSIHRISQTTKYILMLEFSWSYQKLSRKFSNDHIMTATWLTVTVRHHCIIHILILERLKCTKYMSPGAWVAQLVNIQFLISAQVMRSSLTWSLLNILLPSLSAHPLAK